MKSYSAAYAVNKNLQFTQYTLSALLSSFPWTKQKSIIVENSKIVFFYSIFSTIMEFDCTWFACACFAKLGLLGIRFFYFSLLPKSGKSKSGGASAWNISPSGNSEGDKKEMVTGRVV